jgi:hypothetical protein
MTMGKTDAGPMDQFNAALKKRQTPAVSGAVAAVIGDGRVSAAVRQAAEFLAKSGDPAAVSDGGGKVRSAVEHLDLVVKGFGADSPEASAAIRELDLATADAERLWVGEQLTQPAALSAGVIMSIGPGLVRATVAAAGTHQARSPAGGRVAVRFDHARLQHFVSQFVKMKRLGLRVPVCWGHALASLPYADDDERAYAGARYNAGYLESLTVSPDGRLEMTANLPGVKVGRDGSLTATATLPGGQVVPTAIKEVSPFIGQTWTDGRGRTWTDIVAHVALTPFPVLAGQKGFQPLGGRPAVAGYYVSGAGR